MYRLKNIVETFEPHQVLIIAFVGALGLSVAIAAAIWIPAYNACRDSRCPGSHAVLTKSAFDLPVCTCAAP